MARYLEDTRRRRSDSSKRGWTTSHKKWPDLDAAGVINLPE
jgi:hypothetical protein